MNRNSKFLRREFFKALLPIMLSVLGGTINSLIDSIFVSQKLGSEGLAAVNMSIPVYFVICTLGTLLVGGAYTLSSQSIGEKKVKKSAEYYHVALFWCVIFGLIFCACGVVFGDALGSLLAQNGPLTGYVTIYSKVTLIGSAFTILLYLPLYYLQLDGKNKEISIMMGIMILADILADYVFLYIWNLGLLGAALASILSTAFAMLYGFGMLERGYSNYHFQREKLKAKGLKRIVKVGSPIAMGNLGDTMKLLCLNAIILFAGGTDAVAVWAILNSLLEFSMMIISGIPQTSAPLLASFYSTKENGSIRIMIKLQILSGIILGAIYGMAILLLHKPLGRLFAAPESLLIPLICLAFFILFDTICNIWSVYFTVIEKTLLSNVFISFRKFIFPIGIALLLVKTGGYLWLFLPLSSVFTLAGVYAVTGVIAYRTKGGRHELTNVLLLDDSLEREHKVFDFSIEPTQENICIASERIQDFCLENHMNSKQTMRFGLAIEEFMMLILNNDPKLHSVDLRAFALNSSVGIAIRYSGKAFNPLEEDEAEDNLSVMMLKNIVSMTRYTYSFGINIVDILLDENKNRVDKMKVDN